SPLPRTKGISSGRDCVWSASFGLRPRYEKIAAASHSLNPLTALRRSQLPAHVAHVNVDDAIKRPKLPTKHALGELLAGEDSSGSAQKGFKQCELHAGQVQRSVLQPDFTRYGIETEIPCNQRSC